MRTDVITKNAQGEIMVPESQQLKYIMGKRYIHHNTPTTDPGFYHRHEVFHQIAWDAHMLEDKFILYMQSIPGYTLINREYIRRDGMGPHTNRYIYFYAIDGPMPSGVQPGNRMMGEMLYPYY